MFHVKHIKEDIQMNEAKTLVIRGNLVDIINRRTFGAEISILNGHIGKVIPDKMRDLTSSPALLTRMSI